MNLERIASLLSQNLKPSQVASIVGCSPARITQLTSQDDFKLILADKQALAEKESTESSLLDAKYLHAEHSLLNSIVELSPSADLRDVTSALRVITERQFRKQQITNPIHQGNVTLTQNNITLSLPKHALPEISLNTQNEVIAIDQQTLAPLSSTGVTDLFKRMKENDTERIHRSSGQNASITSQEVLTLESLTDQREAPARSAPLEYQHSTQQELSFEDTF